MRPSNERQAILDWAAKHPWNIAAVLTMPKSLMTLLNQTCVRSDETTLSRQLMRCFNKLDRKIFRNAHTRRGVRVPRFITLEKTDGIGWHANVLMRQPKHMTGSALALLLQRIWLEHLVGFNAGGFNKHLFWADYRKDDFLDYSLKHIDRHAVVDWPNVSINSSELV